MSDVLPGSMRKRFGNLKIGSRLSITTLLIAVTLAVFPGGVLLAEAPADAVSPENLRFSFEIPDSGRVTVIGVGTGIRTPGETWWTPQGKAAAYRLEPKVYLRTVSDQTIVVSVLLSVPRNLADWNQLKVFPASSITQCEIDVEGFVPNPDQRLVLLQAITNRKVEEVQVSFQGSASSWRIVGQVRDGQAALPGGELVTCSLIDEDVGIALYRPPGRAEYRFTATLRSGDAVVSEYRGSNSAEGGVLELHTIKEAARELLGVADFADLAMDHPPLSVERREVVFRRIRGLPLKPLAGQSDE